MSPSKLIQHSMEGPDFSGSTGAKPGFKERRKNRRYGIELEFDLFYLWGANHLIWAGTGRTLNWSRNSVLVEWSKPLAAGNSVELIVRWSPGVQLIVVGRVLATSDRGAVVRMVRRRFRGKPEFAVSSVASPITETQAASAGYILAG